MILSIFIISAITLIILILATTIFDGRPAIQ